MLDEIDAAYYRRRAQAERRKADELEDQTAVEAHRRLADLCEEKVQQLTGMVETD